MLHMLRNESFRPHQAEALGYHSRVADEGPY